MKTTLAVLAALCLCACEWDVREEPAPRPYDPPPYDPTPMPSSSSSSEAQLPTFGTSDASASTDEDASAAPAYACEGTPIACSDLDSLSCESQRGCTESLSDGTCIGSPTPCSWLASGSTCNAQIGCYWTQVPR